MAQFKLALDTPATFIHGITGRDTERAILPAGTRYDFEYETDEGQNTTILVYADDETLYRYRVRTADLSGIAI